MKDLFFVTFVICMLSLAAYLVALDVDRHAVPCPDGYAEGDVITHLVGEYQGVIVDCQDGFVEVDMATTTRWWNWDHVREFTGVGE